MIVTRWKILIESIVKNKVLRNAQMIQQYKAQLATPPKESLIFRTERTACTSETLRSNVVCSQAGAEENS